MTFLFRKPPGDPGKLKGFIDNLEDLTEDNRAFRRVVYTGRHLQLVLMSLAPGEDIGEEVHATHDQFFRVEEGEGAVVINGVRTRLRDDDAVIVPAGARHNVFNTGREPLKLYTLYGPPEHRDGVVHHRKADALKSDEHFDGGTTE